MERNSLSIAREFARRGIEIEFAVLSAKGALLSEARNEFIVHDMGVQRVRDAPRRIAQLLDAQDYSYVRASIWPLTSAAVLGRALSRWGGHLMLSEHNPLANQYGGKGAFHRLALKTSLAISHRMADSVVTVSRDVALDIHELCGLRLSRMTIIPNPVAPRRPPSKRDLDKAARLWAAGEAQKILTVGSLKAQKNHALLIEAIARKPRGTAVLMILGEGGLRDELEALASRLGIAAFVRFAGFHPDPSPYFATADTFALSSDYEGFGNVLVEALAAGLPIVSTDCPGGPKDILDKGRYGKLVPVGDVEAMARAFDLGPRVPDLQSRQRRRAADFDVRSIASQYLRTFGISTDIDDDTSATQPIR